MNGGRGVWLWPGRWRWWWLNWVGSWVIVRGSMVGHDDIVDALAVTGSVQCKQRSSWWWLEKEEKASGCWLRCQNKKFCAQEWFFILGKGSLPLQFSVLWLPSTFLHDKKKPHNFAPDGKFPSQYQICTVALTREWNFLLHLTVYLAFSLRTLIAFCAQFQHL